MRDSDEKIIKITFLFSLLAHCLVLGIPGFNFNRSHPEKPKQISIQIEIEKLPPLLPKIDIMGEKKKLKAENRKEQKHLSEPDLQPKEEKIVEVEESKPELEEKIEEIIVEEAKPEPPKEIVKVINPQDEAMLRYQDMIKQKIESCRRYPNWAKKQGFGGISCLTFTVLSSGMIQDVEIVHSSGFDILDNEAVSTIKRASPFLPIPKKFNYSRLKIEVAVVFRLK